MYRVSSPVEVCVLGGGGGGGYSMKCLDVSVSFCFFLTILIYNKLFSIYVYYHYLNIYLIL